MKLRFEVDQAEAFRRGVDTPQSIVTLDVNPKDLSQKERDLIADRLDGIDVMKLTRLGLGSDDKPTRGTSRIRANLPTWDSLLEAVKTDNENLWRQTEGRLVRQMDEVLDRIDPLAQT